MNRLVLLNEVRKEKTKNKNRLLEFNKIKSVEEDSNKEYINFKDKFDCYHNKKISHTKHEKTLNKIMKRIFSLDNKMPLIAFLNSIYNDDLSTKAGIEYIKNKDISNNNEVINFKNSNYNIGILVEDDYRKFEYQIQFQTRDDKNIAITINKIDLTDDYYNIVHFSKKKREYEKDTINKNNSWTRCLIMLNCNIEIPDVYEFKSDFDGESTNCKVNIIKSWKYDFKKLFENSMYLLFPIKALDLNKRLFSMSEDITSKSLIKDEIYKFFKDMNKHLKNIKDKNLMTDKDIDELNLIAIDLLNQFIGEKNNIRLDIKSEIEATLRAIVV